MSTRQFQSSKEQTTQQNSKTPFDVPPTPQRAPGRSGCPSETSTEVPERLWMSLRPDPHLQMAAVLLALNCSSSFPLKTVNSARQKHLREKARRQKLFSDTGDAEPDGPTTKNTWNWVVLWPGGLSGRQGGWGAWKVPCLFLGISF